MPDYRADQGPSLRPLVVDNLRGGLDTLSPPHKVMPGSSPDLLNVVLTSGAVRKRGGFVPVCRELTKAISLANRGVTAKGRAFAASSVNTDYRTVAGACHAGHRSAWNDADVRNGITIDFFCTIADLTSSVGGNGSAVGAPFGPSPYTVKVRPILSKGPTKRWADTAQLGPNHTTGAIAWSTASRWGPLGAGQHAMPFAVYLWNNGGTWEFAVAWHYWDSVAAQWNWSSLSTPITAVGGVRLDTLYQVTCGYDIAGNTSFLRVGARFDTGTPQYVTVTGVAGTNATAMPFMTPTPVQLFDCPQEFIEAPNAASATRPPGLGLGGAADGGYWFASMRFEGQIEDIAIYRGLVASASTGALDRTGRIDPNNPPATLLQHWPVSGQQDDTVEESSGLGNHFHRVPAGPTWNAGVGGLGGGALLFNGTTSYALIETGNNGTYNWRLGPDGVAKGQMWALLAYNFGLEVSFWPESIETNFEQVIAEIHGILRLVIDTDGRIRVYVRSSTVVGNASQYQPGATSTNRVIPGERYHVIVMVNRSAPSIDLVVNGVRDTAPALGGVPDATWPTSGVTLGMGAFRVVNATASGALLSYTPGSDQINTDSRSGFFGRIESFRILQGAYQFDTPVPTYGGEVPSQHHQLTREQFDVQMPKRMDFPSDFAGARTTITPTHDDEDPLANIETGHGVVAAQFASAAGIPHVRAITNAASAAYAITAIPARASQSIFHLYAFLRVTKVLGAWDFDHPTASDPESGGYSQAVESSYATPTSIVINGEKVVWVNRVDYEDLTGNIGPVQFRCIESDAMAEYDAAGTWDFRYQRRFKPYLFTAPKLLAPQWDKGLVTPNLGEAPVSLVTSWSEEQSGDRFLFARSRRSLYWVKRPWRVGSPFDAEETAEALWFFGQRNDWCRSSGMTAHGTGDTWATHSAFVDMWVMPQRLDGKRLIVAYGDNIGATLRYMVYLDQGCLYVAGNNSGGALWRYFHGSLNGANQEMRETSVALNKWTHIQVLIGSSTVLARIDGQVVTITKSFSSPSVVAANIPSATRLWIGGMDADQMAIHDATYRFLLKPFCGLITDIRERDTEDLSWWGTGESGVPPQLRAVSDGNTRWLYSASSDTGWSVPTGVVGVPALEVGIRELVGIAHNLADVEREPASAVVFRNALIFTQPGANPQRVRFLGYQNQGGPFRCDRLGMAAPGVQYANYYGFGAKLVTQDDTSTPTFTSADQTYVVYVSFLNDLGEESEAEAVGSALASVTSYAVLHVWDVPRSADPQVVARNLYLSINGATPLFVGTLYDNKTDFFEIQGRGHLNAAPTDGTFLPAPIARRVAVGPGALVLTTLGGNPNSFAVSGESPAYFPLIRQIVVDSENGEPVVSASSYLGTIYVFKRDGTWAFVTTQAQDSLFSAGLRSVNSSAAAGGGVAIYDNVMYGASRRGVWLFDGNNYVYASPPLEGEFPSLDTQPDGLLAMQGAFLEPESQYWLSVRQRGDRFNEVVYVLHPGAQAGWTKLQVPRHIALARVDSDATGQPQVLIGTLHGEILRYDPDAFVDGVRDVAHHAGEQVISGTPSVSSTTSLTIGAGAFDTAYSGLRGRALQFLDANGVLLATRTILSNTATILTWDEDYTVPAGATFHVGGYSAHWSTGWLAPQAYGSFLMSTFIDLDFEPHDNDLVIENQSAMTASTDRAFDSSDAELRVRSMSKGYVDQPIPTQAKRHGRYWRLRVGTNGSQRPFGLTGFGLRFAEAGTQGRPT